MPNGYNESPVVLPSYFGQPGNAMQSAIASKEREAARQYEIDYRNQQNAQADEWKKLNLIQDLTDLSKHQTGNDVADALANQQVSKIFQKYTSNIKNLSPAELQYGIQKDMNGIISSVDGIKTELNQYDENLKTLKQQFPELDVAGLSKALRADVVNRRMKNDSEFNNPMEVQQSQINLGDPEYLSRFVTGDKNLRTMFTKPEGLDDVNVFKGTPNSYTKYRAKIPVWKKPNYNPDELKEGFLPKSFSEPQLDFKTETLPSDALPSSNGKPFEIISKDVFDGVTGKEKLELVAATRDKFPNYDKFNPTEKEYAQRNVFLDLAKTFDQTGFYPSERHNPSASLLKLSMGGGSGSQKSGNINDVYQEVLDVTNTNGTGITVNGKRIGTRMNALSADAQRAIFDLFGGRNDDLNESNTFIGKDGDGTMRLYRTNDKDQPEIDIKYEVGVIPKVGTNLRVQPSVLEKREVIKTGNQSKDKEKISW